jgi:hypothetical protein
LPAVVVSKGEETAKPCVARAGHFAAFEEPQRYLDDVRDFFCDLP